MKTKLFCLLISCIGVLGTLDAQIWTNPITGTNPGLNNPYSIGNSVTGNMTVYGIGHGTGVGGTTANNRYNCNGWNSSSIDPADYYYFIMTPNTNYKINFTSFVYTGQTSGTGPVSFSLRSSLDGFSSDIGTATATGTTIDLSAATYQSITTSIEFRLYAWGASGAGGTFSINDFSFNGSINLIAAGTSYGADYYRSSGSGGNWNSPSTWESSHDNSTWITATLTPTTNAAAITIKSGTTVTVNTDVTAKSLTVESGATLDNPVANKLVIYDGTADTNPDLIINGTYNVYGRMPVLVNAASAEVNGTVVAKDNSSPNESDDFAYSNSVVFKTNAVFEWANTFAFETNPSSGFNLIYFPNSSSYIPVFRVTSQISVGWVGANANTWFYGKFEIASGKTLKFANTGTKYFIRGIGGAGTITHARAVALSYGNCGLFQIGDASHTATIDGTVTIKIEEVSPSTDMEIKGNTTISGSPTITLGSNGFFSNGGSFIVSGVLTHNGSVPINIISGNLVDSGTIASTSTGTFTCGSTYTSITGSGSVNHDLGVLKLTPGGSTVKSFTLNSGASGTGSTWAMGSDMSAANMTFTRGKLLTDEHLVIWLNNGGTFTSPNAASYKNSFIATCKADGSALTDAGLNVYTNQPFAGGAGFRVTNMSGSSYLVFPVSCDTISPNRMEVNPNGVSTSMTVVVGRGDILNTPSPMVNRVWYVYASPQSTVSMKLHFTKYNWSTNHFGVAQDEVEDGFITNPVALVRKDYSGGNYFTHSANGNNVGSLDGTEGTVTYSLTNLPNYYRFGIADASGIILPVALSNVKAYEKNKTVQIEWTTFNEINIDHYEVERSSNASQFSKAVQVQAKNNNQQNSYAAVDVAPLKGINYYRIKAVSKDGTMQYSGIVSVNLNAGVGVNVQPNPIHNKTINLQINIPAGNYDLILYSIHGQRVYNTRIVSGGTASAQTMVLPNAIANGVYILTLQGSVNSERYNTKVIIE